MSESLVALTGQTLWFWRVLGGDVESTLTAKQKRAIENAVQRSSKAAQLSDIKLSFGKFFVRIISGKERRSRQRLLEERAQEPVIIARNLPIFVVFWGSAAFTLYSIVGFTARVVSRLFL